MMVTPFQNLPNWERTISASLIKPISGNCSVVPAATSVENNYDAGLSGSLNLSKGDEQLEFPLNVTITGRGSWYGDAAAICLPGYGASTPREQDMCLKIKLCSL